jgi:hypothetical protein
MTRTGVRPLTALAYVLIIGMIPSEDSSAGEQRLFDPGKGADDCYQVKLKATTYAAIIISRLPISCPRVPTVA